MKTFLKSTIVVLQASLVALPASAGEWSSGGGNSVVCYDESQKIVSAELLDLYEARNMYGWTLVEPKGDVLDQALRAAQKIGEGTTKEVFDSQLQRLADEKRILPEGTGLATIDDSKHIVIPKDCSVRQVARLERNGKLFIDGEIWAAMNVQNRAALLVHEVVYMYLRTWGDDTSVRTRRAVGAAFSGKTFEPVNADIPPEAEYCETDPIDGIPWASFVTYPESDGTIMVQFIILDGLPMLSKSTVRLNNVSWPLSTSNEDPLVFARLNSIVDSGLPIGITVTPEDNFYTGTIGFLERISSPKHKFVCSDPRNKK